MKKVISISLVILFALAISLFAMNRDSFRIISFVEQPKEFMSYNEALEHAKKDNQPLIVFVDTEPKKVDGFVVGYEKSFSSLNLEKGYVVSWFDNSGKHVGYIEKGEFAEESVYRGMKSRAGLIPRVLSAKFEIKTKNVEDNDLNSDHKCPKCGTYQFVHNTTNNDGSHSHKCPSCGTEWWHGGNLGYPGTRQNSQPTLNRGFGFELNFYRPTMGGG